MDAVAGEGGQGAQHRKFVDHAGDLLRSDFQPFRRARANQHTPTGSLPFASCVWVSSMSAPASFKASTQPVRVEVQADVDDFDLGAGQRRGGAGPEGRGGDVAGHFQPLPFDHRLLRALDRDPPAVLLELDAEGLERPLRVIARGGRLDHAGAALGLHAREEHRRLHLSARHFHRVFNAAQVLADDGDGRKAPFGHHDRAHFDERNGDPAHRPAARDRSPVKVDWKGCAASNPVSIRIVEPELPQSSAVWGSRRPSTPRPRMRT